jgi:uncharacterized membrane protein YhiD involved in acid resistance
MHTAMVVLGIFAACVFLYFLNLIKERENDLSAKIASIRKEIEAGAEEVEKDIERLRIRGIEEAKKTVSPDSLRHMTKSEIKSFGKSFNIDLSMRKKKDQMIQDFFSELNGN